MGLVLKVKENVGAAAGYGLAIPVKSGLVLANLTYNSLTQAVKNYSGMDAAVVGSPVASATGVEFDALDNYLTTNVPESSNMTIIAVAKAIANDMTQANSGVIAGTFETSVGANLYMRSDGFLASGYYLTEGSSTFKQAVVAATSNTKHYLVSARIGDSGITIKNHTDNLSTTTPSATARDVSSRTMRIGSAYKTLGGKSKIAFIAIYNRILTDDEITLVAEYARKHVNSIGIIV